MGHDSISTNCWTSAVLMGLCGALGNWLMVKALKAGDLSVIGPINAYKVIIGLILGVIFLKEIPNLTGVIGILLIFCGSFFLLDTTDEKFTIKLFQNRAIQYRFLSLLFCAIEAIVIKQVIILSSAWTAFVLWCFLGAVFSGLIYKFEKLDITEEVSKLKNKNTVNIVNIVICVGIMQFTTNYIFARMNVAYALSLFQLSSILCIFMGYKFFQEGHMLKRLVGSSVMIAGAVLIILFN